MKLNVLSDLHLSRGALEIPDNDADVAVLAGDIARPAQAVAWASGFAKPVLYVPGNHECYGSSVEGAVAELKRLCAGTRIRVLDQDVAIIDGVRFLGATLWTDFMLFGSGRQAAAMQEAVLRIRDFSSIRAGDAPDAAFTPHQASALFHSQLAWLESALAEPHEGPTVVITHHAPSRRSVHPRFADSLLSACFVSDAEHVIAASCAQLWIHGHTHDSFDYRVNRTRVICNPRGYAKDGVNENTLFDADLVVAIE